MATNLNVVYSDTFKGAGLVSGGPYMSEKYLPFAGLYSPIKDIDRDPQKLSEETSQDAKDNADSKLIDAVSNLKDQPIYILSNTEDIIVPPELH